MTNNQKNLNNNLSQTDKEALEFAELEREEREAKIAKEAAEKARKEAEKEFEEKIKGLKEKSLTIGEADSGDDFIFSPDGKYKFPKPKNIEHSDLLDGGERKLPDLNVPGFKTVWIHDANPSTIFKMTQRGYDFCPQSVLDKVGIRKGQKIGAGLPKLDGKEEAIYYAMQIPEDKWKMIEDLRAADLKKKEKDALTPKMQSEAGDTESKVYHSEQIVRS